MPVFWTRKVGPLHHVALAFLTIAASMSAAGADTPDAARIAKAKEAVANVLESRVPPKFDVQTFEDEHLDGADRYLSLGFQRAFAALERAKISDFERPMLFFARIVETENKQIQLGMFWLSSVDNIAGVQIQDSCARVLATGTVRYAFVENTVEQTGAAFISFNDRPDKGAQLTIDPKVFAGELQVALVEKGGRTTKPLRAWVDDDVRRRAAAARHRSPLPNDPTSRQESPK